jgi:hypothetical protein
LGTDGPEKDYLKKLEGEALPIACATIFYGVTEFKDN